MPTSSRQFRRAVIYSLVLLTGLVSGCGTSSTPELAPVRGTVTLDGQPLAGATVIFEPTDGGRSSHGQTDAEGKYRLNYIRDIQGAKVGSHYVSITTASEANLVERLPAGYNRQTTLTATVTAGKNDCDFELRGE